MTAKTKSVIMSEFGVTFDGTVGDIINCAMKNDFQGVDRILARDSLQINAQHPDNGISALMAASGRGLERMVAHLLSKAKVDTSLVDDFGKDALLHARPFPRVVGLIMEKRNPNLRWQEPNFRPV